MITALLGFRPDTAWTGRTARESRHSDTDPLVADALYNVQYSRLCGLPEKVLLRIMEQLDPIGVQCLRRTSRLFLRLFCDEQFGQYHYHDLTRPNCTNLTGPPVYFPWVRSCRVLECMYPRTPGITPLHQLLEQDTISSICSTCKENRAARQAWNRTLRIKRTTDTAWRYCIPCGLDHPPAYFSRIRRCIGRLGHVRLCEHEDCVISWDKVIKYGKQLARIDLPEPARVRLLVCRDESHLPVHHHSKYGTDSGYPSVTITGSRSTAVRLDIKWTGHMLLPEQPSPLHSRDGKKKLTPTEMTRLLKHFRRGTPAEFIVPQSSPGSLPEMRCFDPNRCRCLHYPGEEDVPGGWQLARRQRREDRARNHSRNQVCCFPSTGGDMGTTITGTHTSRCVLSRDSETRMDIDACAAPVRGRLSSCLRITYRRSILIAAEGEECRAVTQSWYEAIDPGSYGGLALGGYEKRAFDVLACPHDDPACANYCRYLERPLMRDRGRDDQGGRPSRGRSRGDRWEKGKVKKEKEEVKKEEGEEAPGHWGRFWVIAMANEITHAKGCVLGVAFVVVLANIHLRWFVSFDPCSCQY